MLRTRQPRPARARRALLTPVAALAALALLVPPAAADDGADLTGPLPASSPDTPVPDPMPQAQAFDGAKPLPSVHQVTGLCAHGRSCSFRVDRNKSREYSTAVLSVGNGAINCTGKSLIVRRIITLATSSMDNIGGEITGEAAIEGTIEGLSEVSASVTNETGSTTSHTDHSSDKEKGPNSEDKNSSTTTNSAKVGSLGNVTLGARAAFSLAFLGKWQHEWRTTNTETTDVKFEVKPNDELQFGMLNAMERTVGKLTVDGTGKLVKDITVDSPSTANVSSLVAQTFTSQGRCLTLRPKGRALPVPGLVEVAPSTGRPTASYALAADGRWVRLPH